MREWQWRHLVWCLLLVPLWARSDVPTPPAAFWDYLEDFGDQEGDVFDPLDLTEAEKIVRPATDANTMTEVKKPQQEESQP